MEVNERMHFYSTGWIREQERGVSIKTKLVAKTSTMEENQTIQAVYISVYLQST